MAFLTSDHALPLDPRDDPDLAAEEERERMREQLWKSGLYDYAWDRYEEIWQELQSDAHADDSATPEELCLIRARLLQ